MLKINCGVYKRIKCPKLNIFSVRCESSVATLESEFSDKPEYPPIHEVTPIAEEFREKLKYYEKIKSLATVEEKLLALNLPRYYGWPTFLLKEGVVPYNFLSFVQHITRTELYETNKLPVSIETEKADAILMRIKLQLEKLFVFEKVSKKYKFEVDGSKKNMSDAEINDAYSTYLIWQINRVFINNLVAEYPHLLLSQVDYKPRLESFWRVGGFYPTTEDKEVRKQHKLPEERLDEPIERCFQFIGAPVLSIRNRLPLSPFQIKGEVASMDNNPELPSVASSDLYYPIESYYYDPNLYYRVPRERMMAVVSPGFWPNDPFQFGLLSYHNRGYLVDRPPNFGEIDQKEALHSQAILIAYAWVLAQAYYQGFSTFYDITYPIVTQTIVTDGKLFSFYTYQLNTTVLHSDYTNNETNPFKNTCYGTQTQELYHEIRDNKVIGWNDEVLHNLLSFYTNIPSKREGVDMNPYLSKTKVLANETDVKRRIWLHDTYRYHLSRRPRAKLPPEIYDWEMIYKIKFQKRIMDPRRRFFELDQDPLNDRKLHQHRLKYVPRAFRETGKEKVKYADQYYPNVYPEYVDIV